MNPHEAPLRTKVADFCSAWERQDVRALVSLWDRDHTSISYVAEEVPSPLLSWSEVEGYLESITARFKEVQVQVHPVRIDIFGNTAVILGTGGFLAVSRSGGHRVESRGVRILFVFNRRDSEWRLVHYYESPVKHVQTPPDAPAAR